MGDPRYPIGEWSPPDLVGSEEIDGLIERLESLPVRMRSTVSTLSPEQLDQTYRPGGWTLRQVVHHVPESHMNAFVRWKWALTEDNPRIKGYDEKGWAETPEISRLPVETSLTMLDAVHGKWLALIHALDRDRLWDTTLQHHEYGRVDLATMLSLYAWHGDHHLAHITTAIASSD